TDPSGRWPAPRNTVRHGQPPASLVVDRLPGRVCRVTSIGIVGGCGGPPPAAAPWPMATEPRRRLGLLHQIRVTFRDRLSPLLGQLLPLLCSAAPHATPPSLAIRILLRSCISWRRAL